MRSFLVLSTLAFLASCNGAGSGESSFDAKSLSSSEALSKFESDVLPLALALEDEASLRFNPCRDDIKWDADSKTVEFSGMAFEAIGITDITKNGDCDYVVHSDQEAALYTYKFRPLHDVISLRDNYTAILVSTGGSVMLNSDVAAYSPSLRVSETGVFASYGMKDLDTEEFGISWYKYLEHTNAFHSLSYAMFEVNFDNDSVNIEHYSSLKKGNLDTKVYTGETYSRPVHHQSDLTEITMSRYENAYGTTTTRGGLGFIMFDRLLTTQEKQLMGCYTLYISLKLGEPKLWEDNFSKVCNIK